MGIATRVVALGLVAFLAAACCSKLVKPDDPLPPEPTGQQVQSPPLPPVPTVDAPTPPAPAQQLVKPPEWAHFVPTLTFIGSIDDTSVSAATAIIDTANAAHVEALLLVIDSPGGSLDAGYKFLRAVEGSHAPVICVVDGQASSMASALLQVCSVRLMTTRSRLMIHQSYLMFSQDSAVRTDDIRNLSEENRVINRGFIALIAKRLCMNTNKLLAMTDHGLEWWLSADDADAADAVDGVVSSVAGLEAELHANGRAPVAARQCLDLGTLPPVQAPKLFAPKPLKSPRYHRQ